METQHMVQTPPYEQQPMQKHFKKWKLIHPGLFSINYQLREVFAIHYILQLTKIARLFTYTVCFWFVDLVYSNNDGH
jgi:hypothetical protein